FDQPLEARFDIRQTSAGPIIDQLIAQASFLRLEGRGGLTDGAITANADLNQLVAELERLIDWGDTRLAGTLAANLRWNHDNATDWTANADAVVQDFEAVARGLTPWKEPRMHAEAHVRGELSGSSLARINAGKFVVEAGADRLDAELTEPVKSPSLASV